MLPREQTYSDPQTRHFFFQTFVIPSNRAIRTSVVQHTCALNY